MTDVPAYCGHCGELRSSVETRDHSGCDAQLVLEPPRFCTVCRRRMKVQVTPRGWTADCSEHGTLSG